MLEPLERIWKRVETDKEDSDTAYFTSLMYTGELLAKLTVGILVAAIPDNRERTRYKSLHKLVRADGIGDWANVANDVLVGPSSQHLDQSAREDHRALTQKVSDGDWHYQVVRGVHSGLTGVVPNVESLPQKVQLRSWIDHFVRLRNKTRGHGAPTADILASACPSLEDAFRILTDNHVSFKREFAFIRRNLSGKYHVVPLSTRGDAFDEVKKKKNIHYKDGAYIAFTKPEKVEFLETDIARSDFYVFNGGYNGVKYEMLSYITGDVVERDATPFHSPPGELPESETTAKRNLELEGSCFANIPPLYSDYIQRPNLERDLEDLLANDRHPVITLIGRGGIGKTSLALAVLRRILRTNRYDLAIWFSARDIDLASEGPKQVRPDVFEIEDVAKEYTRLLQPTGHSDKSFDKIEYLQSQITRSDDFKKLLVFDNFETMDNPVDTYAWIDTYVRPPNKVLITTRFRDFKGDYPVEVGGMEDAEAQELIKMVAKQLGVYDRLTEKYQQDLLEESGGHPYIIKVLLGEAARSKTISSVNRILATGDNVLTALFERTFANISPMSQRVFLTVANWKSTIPRVACEAILLRSENERIDVDSAFDELTKSSMIEEVKSELDGEYFITVPIAAQAFGKSKLEVSSFRSAVLADLKLLHEFGGGRVEDVRHGISPRISRFVRFVAVEIGSGKAKLHDYMPVLEFLARRNAETWLSIAQLKEEEGGAKAFDDAKESVKRYIEVLRQSDQERFSVSESEAWSRVIAICRQDGDSLGEVHALVELCKSEDVLFFTISNSANRFNQILSENPGLLEGPQKKMIAEEMANLVERKIGEGGATDRSRLAWLFMHLQQEGKAKVHVGLGLQTDPENAHCRKLALKLRM